MTSAFRELQVREGSRNSMRRSLIVFVDLGGGIRLGERVDRGTMSVTATA